VVTVRSVFALAWHSTPDFGPNVVMSDGVPECPSLLCRNGGFPHPRSGILTPGNPPYPRVRLQGAPRHTLTDVLENAERCFHRFTVGNGR
jgi:hypothetical protein